MVQVAAALIWRGDRFMICQRPVNKTRALTAAKNKQLTDEKSEENE